MENDLLSLLTDMEVMAVMEVTVMEVMGVMDMEDTIEGNDPQQLNHLTVKNKQIILNKYRVRG